MAHLQYMPGDPRLVDQLIYELKSKGIFDQFRKDCIADVDTKPAYQNLRQRVENSVSTFLSRQTWQPDLNKNQLREKLRKHILDGNYLEQGVERIVDQVVNPKIASVFIPKVEDLVYNYLGITRKKSPPADTSNDKVGDLLPNDLEAVSPGSVKSNDDKAESMEVDDIEKGNKMEVDEGISKSNTKEDGTVFETEEKEDTGDIQLPTNGHTDNMYKINIPLPYEEIKPENIPSPDTSPSKVELEKIELPKEPVTSIDIPLPKDLCKDEKDQYFKPINTDDDDSSSDSSLRRNMSPLTPIRNFNNENSCDAQQAFENDLAGIKSEDKKEPSSFRFTIETKLSENSLDAIKSEKKDTETNLSYQFNSQVNINNFNTPLYEDSSNSNNLQIDYESDANSKAILETKIIETDQTSDDCKKEKKAEEKKTSHKSSHRSRDSYKHSSSKDKRSDSKHSSSRDSSKHDKSKSSKDEIKSKSDKDKSKDKNDKKDSSRDLSKQRSSHKSSHRDSKSHRSSSSSGRHSSKHNDEKKSSSSMSVKDKDKTSDKSSSEKSKDSKSSSHRSDKDKKSSSIKNDKNTKSKNEEKDKEKKNKKESDDHYSVSGRGNPNRRSTDRDSNDGSSSSKGSHNPSNSKSSNSKKDSKSSSKSESTSTSGDSTSPSDKENIVREHGNKTRETLQHKPIVRIESHLETPVMSPPRLPFVPDVTIKKPKFAANLEEAKRMMKMRKFLDEEQKRMNQEAALLLEFQANVRPSMSQVYSSIPGPELEFACITPVGQRNDINSNALTVENGVETHYTNNELLTVLNDVEDDEVAAIVFNNNMHTENIINADSDNVEVISYENNPQVDTADLTNDKSTEIEDRSIDNPKPDIDGIELTNIDTTPISCSDISTVAVENDVTNEVVQIKTSKQVEKTRSDLFEITIITEELSENEEVETNDHSESSKFKENVGIDELVHNQDEKINGENKLHYFAEHEKYDAELERARFTNFFKEYSTNCSLSNKIYLVNCGTYEQSILRDVSSDLGDFEFINYHKNGHLKPPHIKNVIRNVNISTEISLPLDTDYDTDCEQIVSHNVFSPEKSECSFELSSDYDSKLEEMVNRTSRQEIMEIILGNIIDASPSKMPRIDYFTDSNIDSDYENNLKRKISDVETTVNNNRPVLTSNKIRKLSTDQITSTTQDNEERSNSKIQNNPRSKYLGRAKRVGLSRPRRTILPNSPSSDKSVENYEENTPDTPQPPNGKIKRTKVQRYDTSDLYKPKLNYLSRRNHIT